MTANDESGRGHGMTGQRYVRETTVDDYLASIPAKDREVLEQLRRAIREAAPEARETISHGVPTFLQNGPLVHFAAFRDHDSLIVASRAVVERFRDDLEGYSVSGTTVRFRADRPLPADLIARIVRARVEENESGLRGN